MAEHLHGQLWLWSQTESTNPRAPREATPAHLLRHARPAGRSAQMHLPHELHWDEPEKLLDVAQDE